MIFLEECDPLLECVCPLGIIFVLSIPSRDVDVTLLLYTRMAPLRPSADFPYVGAQKDTYGLRFA